MAIQVPKLFSDIYGKLVGDNRTTVRKTAKKKDRTILLTDDLDPEVFTIVRRNGREFITLKKDEKV